MRKAIETFNSEKALAEFLIHCGQVKNITALEEAALRFQHYVLDVTGQKRIKRTKITLNW